MKNICSLLLLLIITFELQAQVPKTEDSLAILLKTKPKDTF